MQKQCMRSSVSGLLLLLLVVKISITAATSKHKPINDIYLSNIINNMDLTVDPCEDFFSYACGQWPRNYNSIDYVDMAGYMDHKVNLQLLEILQAHKDATQKDIYGKLWKYYAACEKLSRPALNSFLKLVQPELNITWPIFREDWNGTWKEEASFNWLSTIAVLRRYGLNGVFLTQSVNVRLDNSSHHILEIQQHHNKHQLRQQDVAEIFISFGMSETESLKLTGEIMILERSMQNLISEDTNMLSGEQKVEPTEDKQFTEKEEEEAIATAKYEQHFKEFTVLELRSKVPAIDWEQYLSIVLNRAVNTSTDQVQIFPLNFQYFEDLNDILTKSSNETIAYYIMLKFMYRLNEELPLFGMNNSVKCIENLRSYMPLAMNYMYEQSVYRNARKQTDSILHAIYRQLTIGFRQLVLENHLKLNATEQDYILAELDTMQLRIGNIPRLLTAEYVADYYEQLRMDSNSFYNNHLQLLRHHTRRELELLSNQAPAANDMHFYHHDPETARSSSPVKIFKNAILLPYGYLQMPFYNNDLDPIFQYSLLGFILAHEIVHAFDLFHIVYDKMSNFNEIGVYVAEHFRPYIDCLGAAGENDTTDNLSENIADVSGLRLVYRTYFKQILKMTDNDDANAVVDIDGFDDFHSLNMNLTKQQLFFINSVQFLCANMGKISTLDLSHVDLEHEMHDARVRVNWALFEEFSKVFKCKKESKMNPLRSCRLW